MQISELEAEKLEIKVGLCLLEAEPIFTQCNLKVCLKPQKLRPHVQCQKCCAPEQQYWELSKQQSEKGYLKEDSLLWMVSSEFF